LTIRHIFPEIEPPNEGQNETERQIDAPMVNSTVGPGRKMWMRAVDQGKACNVAVHFATYFL
jgi:hypothetical protein